MLTGFIVEEFKTGILSLMSISLGTTSFLYRSFERIFKDESAVFVALDPLATDP
jgi:hypothetical protein